VFLFYIGKQNGAPERFYSLKDKIWYRRLSLGSGGVG